MSKLKAVLEKSLYDFWRLGMVLPPSLAVAFWINHMVLGREGFDWRAAGVLSVGFIIAVVSLWISRQVSLAQKFTYSLVTLLVYPLLFIGVLLLGAFADIIFHCGFDGTQ